MFQTVVVEKIKTHIWCSITFFFFENHAVYEINEKYFAEQGRPKISIWRMLIACWIPKVTNTHSEYVILIAFPLQQRLNHRALLLRHSALYALFSNSTHDKRNSHTLSVQNLVLGRSTCFHLTL